MKLERFDKNKKIMVVLSIITLMVGVLFYKSFTFYQEKESFDTEEKIKYFDEKMELAFTVNGTGDQALPKKGEGYTGNVVCKNGATAEWDNEKWGLINVSSNGNSKISCNIDFIRNFSTLVKVGDYVEMTPTLTTYTITNISTGYDSDQTINPSELNLWRVIKINDDGTIEMVSENTSRENIYFQGANAYARYILTLNEIAKQYENEEFTVGSRYIGYRGQTPNITNTAYINQSTPWDYSTSDNRNENIGGGDISYQNDYDLVNGALGTMVSNQLGTSYGAIYWLASRCYTYSSNESYFSGRTVSYSGNVECGYGKIKPVSSSTKYSLRPIVVLKSGISSFSGSGTSSDHWKLG